MGAGMAASLVRAGFAVTGFDLRQDALERLVGQGGRAAASPRAAAEGAELLVVMVVNDGPGRGGAVRRPGRGAGIAGRRHGDAVEHGAGGLRAPPRRAARRARPAPARCPGERRRGRGRAGRADDHGLGPGRGVRRRRGGARRLRQEGLPARRRPRHRLDGQGGQPAARRDQPGDRGRGHGVRRGARRRSKGALRGDPPCRRRLLDVREPRAAHAGRRLHAAQRGRHLGQGPRPGARHRQGAAGCRCRWPRPPIRW